MVSGLTLFIWLGVAWLGVAWLGVAWRQEEDHQGGYFVSVEKSHAWGSRLMISVKRRKRRSLAATGEGSWRGVGHWNARMTNRVNEDLAGLEVMNSLAT
jgi:hypothetical protein